MAFITVAPLLVQYDKSRYFVEECLDHTLGVHGYDQSLIDGLLKAEDLMFSVYRHHKDVGFFVHRINEQTKTISGETYLHPRACNLSLASIMKACAVRSALLADRMNLLNIEIPSSSEFLACSLASLFGGAFLTEHVEVDGNIKIYSRSSLSRIKELNDRMFLRSFYTSINWDRLTFTVDI